MDFLKLNLYIYISISECTRIRNGFILIWDFRHKESRKADHSSRMTAFSASASASAAIWRRSASVSTGQGPS